MSFLCVSAKNGVEVTDKPTAQVKGQVTHHSSSVENSHGQVCPVVNPF